MAGSSGPVDEPSLGGVPVGLGDPLAVIMPSICEDVAPLAAYEQLMHGRLVIASCASAAARRELADELADKLASPRGFEPRLPP